MVGVLVKVKVIVGVKVMVGVKVLVEVGVEVNVNEGVAVQGVLLALTQGVLAERFVTWATGDKG
jgi:hypothetical protein